MTLCTNRPEGFGPLSHIYGHILTSCFLDTVLIPLCTWLYLFTLVILAVTGARLSIWIPHQSSKLFGRIRSRASKTSEDVETAVLPTGGHTLRRSRIHTTFSVLYYFLVVAQVLMCILEIVRLSLARLGIGLLPFTFVTLVTAAAVYFTNGLRGRVFGWKYLNLAVWIALAATNGVKVAEEMKEGIGARKGSKYPVVDEVTDVSVMIGVYAALALLELLWSV